ncbi:hypothetical protein Pcinc_041748 [Petrolisthes cinctipes]|uniref:Uncharacterized protein n=1 Tax=Petrolisthes cinctipes TaxID=88211 RepID=A0AAE1BJM1_PETCI|nr:hypothetical protein Pcinc_041748 [Petrolisthes cinctipes]
MEPSPQSVAPPLSPPSPRPEPPFQASYTHSYSHPLLAFLTVSPQILTPSLNVTLPSCASFLPSPLVPPFPFQRHPTSGPRNSAAPHARQRPPRPPLPNLSRA